MSHPTVFQILLLFLLGLAWCSASLAVWWRLSSPRRESFAIGSMLAYGAIVWTLARVFP